MLQPTLPPILVDSHAHLGMKDFDHDRDQVIRKARQAGISAILCPMELSDPENTRQTLELISENPDIIAAAGIHPHQAKLFDDAYEAKISKLAGQNSIRGVGEIGLDFHYNYSPRKEQISALRRQLALAQRLDLPVILHSRLAAEDILESVHKEHYTRGGVLHCFTEDYDFAKKMLDCNFFISFSGILTFPSAYSLRETARKIPLDKLLVETDSPFLTPVPYRGKVRRNEPFYVKQVALFLADILGLPLDEIARHTTFNFESLFMFEIKKP